MGLTEMKVYGKDKTHSLSESLQICPYLINSKGNGTQKGKYVWLLC